MSLLSDPQLTAQVVVASVIHDRIGTPASESLFHPNPLCSAAVRGPKDLVTVYAPIYFHSEFESTGWGWLPFRKTIEVSL